MYRVFWSHVGLLKAVLSEKGGINWTEELEHETTTGLIQDLQ